MSFPARFGTYELFRIVLPGFFCLGLLCVSAFLFIPTRPVFMKLSRHPAFIFVALSGGIFLGLIMYAYDHPKRIKAYKGLEMPSQYLKKRLCDRCKSPCENKIEDEGEAIDTYLILLTELFEPSTQQRIFYIGSVYHLFADIRMLSLIFGILTIIISLGGARIGSLPTLDSVFGLAVGCSLFLLWLFLHPEFTCETQQSKGDKYFRYIIKLQRRLIDLKIDEIREKVCKHTDKE